ncbi:hypothetical protein ElyMa_000510800 [Elysia marginata]|uniref:Uncharacterized protein n=1 Tax=Elysia marginata TaxID=1093978 RepID=A0AAV4FVS6_9GAST|nr:hypothetical protein ElyMa_000510800 [Elysia marginata]
MEGNEPSMDRSFEKIISLNVPPVLFDMGASPESKKKNVSPVQSLSRVSSTGYESFNVDEADDNDDDDDDDDDYVDDSNVVDEDDDISDDIGCDDGGGGDDDGDGGDDEEEDDDDDYDDDDGVTYISRSNEFFTKHAMR